MNADEIVRVLRSYSQSLVGYKLGCEFADAVENGASLIESLQAQLAASQRRERAAYLDLKYYLGVNEENGVVYMPKFIVERLITLCGPQEAGAEEGAEK
jgi:hypothetical protein